MISEFSSTAPPLVQNLTHIILSDNALQLRWNDPCPSNGKIMEIYIYGYYRDSSPLQSCTTTESFDRCHNITGLKLGEQYEFKVSIISVLSIYLVVHYMIQAGLIMSFLRQEQVLRLCELGKDNLRKHGKYSKFINSKVFLNIMNTVC